MKTPHTAEQAFIEQIDCRFPYDDWEACTKIIDQGIAISPNAAYFVLHEIARPPHGGKPSTDRLRQLLGYWRARFTHPAAAAMKEVAAAIIAGSSLPVEEVIARMEKIAEFRGLHAALDVLYFACDDVDGRLEPVVGAIRRRWSA